MGDAVRDDEDAIRVDLLGPRGRDLAVKESGVDADICVLDVPIAHDRPLGDGTGGSGGSRGCGSGGTCGLQCLGLDLHAVTSLREDLLHDVDSGLGRETRAVGADEHGEIETGNSDPVLVALFLNESRDLVERRSAPEIHQEQNVLLVVKGGDCIEQLLVKRVGAHVRRENDSRNVLLRTEDHAARFHDALGELTVACKNNADHSLPPYIFLASNRSDPTPTRLYVGQAEEQLPS